jgi:hypothetical protein
VTIRRPLRAAVVPTVTLFILTLPVFLRFTPDPGSDFGRHFWFAYQLIHKGDYPPRPLYHYALIVLSGWDPLHAFIEASILLAFAVAITGGLSAAFFASRSQVPVWKLTVLCLALAIAMPLPNWWKFPALYLGQVTPNVWHNPTTIFCLPFALGVFLLSLRALENFSVKIAAGLGCLFVLTVLAKPNFLLAFLPCIAIALNRASEVQVSGRRISLPGQLLRFALAFGPPTLVLAQQALQIDVQRGSIAFDPLTVWLSQTPNIPVSILVGIAFPLFVLIAYWKKMRGEMALLLAWPTLVIAILQYAFLSNGWGAQTDANFGWGMILADHVLFVASCEFLLRQPASRVRLFGWGILGLHTIAGAFYLSRSILTPTGLCDY